MGHPPERRLLPDLPGRHAPGDRDRALLHVPRGVAADPAGLWRSLRDREIAPGDSDARLGWLLVVGTIPAGILGLVLEHALRSLFASATSAAIFLTANGVLLLIFERYRKRGPAERRAAAHADELPPGHGRRHVAGRRAHPRHLALGRDDGQRPARRTVQRGRRALFLPARHADHRRGRAAEAARSLRRQGRRRARPGLRRRTVRRRCDVRGRALPVALLRDQPPDPVRRSTASWRARRAP